MNGPTAYRYLAGTDADSELQQYLEDQLDIGEPTADAVVRADGLVVRAYHGATVIVNPSTKAVATRSTSSFPASDTSERGYIVARRARHSRTVGSNSTSFA